jgi:predicted nucleic acid-binding protein
MSVVVVDASVVIKWFVPEVHGEAALRLLDSDDEFIAPDHLFAETTNAIRKGVRRREISPEEGRDIIAQIDEEAEVELVSCRQLADDAYGLALMCGLSVYDAMYVALAIERDLRLITADDRLYLALARFPDIAAHVQSLRDY